MVGRVPEPFSATSIVQVSGNYFFLDVSNWIVSSHLFITCHFILSLIKKNQIVVGNRLHTIYSPLPFLLLSYWETTLKQLLGERHQKLVAICQLQVKMGTSLLLQTVHSQLPTRDNSVLNSGLWVRSGVTGDLLVMPTDEGRWH